MQVLEVLSSAREYDELPVRHNEDKLNTTLCGLVRFSPDVSTADDPHTKANLLLQVSTVGVGQLNQPQTAVSITRGCGVPTTSSAPLNIALSFVILSPISVCLAQPNAHLQSREHACCRA